MEPLSALPLACNVLQIVEYGANILSKTAEYRSAAEGALAEHERLRGVLKSLKELNVELSAVIAASGDPVGLPLSKVKLVEANEECMRLSDGFFELLDRLKITKRSTIKSLCMSLKSLRFEDKIKCLKDALHEAKTNLVIASLVFSQHDGLVKHKELVGLSNKSADRIVNAFHSSAELMGTQLDLLTTQFNNTSLEHVEQSLREFRAANGVALGALSQKLDAILCRYSIPGTLKQPSEPLNQCHEIQQKNLDSLYFPQMDDRKIRIEHAHKNTYKWVLQTKGHAQGLWDNFDSWSRSLEDIRKLYWINGKPGSGKSTLMKFLYENLDTKTAFLPLELPIPAIKIGHFLWSPGSSLQRSFTGFLRSLLFRMLAYAPHLTSYVVPRDIWRRTQHLPSASDIEWSSLGIIKSILNFVRAKEVAIFFVIDGLDELNGTDQERDDLNDLLRDLATFEHVKICVSSRSWNVFQDAFEGCPQLRLENLTRGDIRRYVSERLGGQSRYRRLRQIDPATAEHLTTKVIERASGVFLWVRLVVRELVTALQDGESVRELISKVEDTPADLDKFFTRLIDSIEPQHRKEASMLLQAALHTEDVYPSFRPFRLLDVVCMKASSSRDFTLQEGSQADLIDFTDTQKLNFAMESAFRLVNSKCLRLLECEFMQGEIDKYIHGYVVEATIDSDLAESADSPPGGFDGGHTSSTAKTYHGVYVPVPESSHPKEFFNWEVNFLHRSLWDFLRTPTNQNKLRQYFAGTSDERLFLCNASLLEMEAVDRSYLGKDLTISLAGCLISAIAVPEFKHSKNCEIIADRIKLVLDRIVDNSTDEDLDVRQWYLCASLARYHEHQSTFLTVAIDFDLEAYVLQHLTAGAISSKAGRPVLDYILQSPFCGKFSVSIGNSSPNPKILRKALQLGADPNEVRGRRSIWAWFLILLDYSSEAGLALQNVPMVKTIQRALMTAAYTLLQHGASPLAAIAVMDDEDCTDYDWYQDPSHIKLVKKIQQCRRLG